MTALDDLQNIKKIDRRHLAKYIADFPSHCAKALLGMEKIKIPDDWKKTEKIAVCGMGGSAIGGDLAKAVLPTKEKMPVSVIRGDDLPAWVDAKTLVVCVSCSGETEETISCFKQALEKKAMIFAVAGGGQLAALAKKNKIPLYEFSCQAPPRASLGYLLVPLLVLWEKIGFLSPEDADLRPTLAFLEEFGANLAPGQPTQDNLAKQLAFAVFDRLPLIVGAGLLASVARRWKTQFNENAKTISFFEELPELNHNTVEGLAYPRRIKDDLLVLLLESPSDPSRVRRRFQILKKLLAREAVEFQEISASGADILTQKLSLVFLGDWISFYLAVLNGTDPSSVENIPWIKKLLR